MDKKWKLKTRMPPIYKKENKKNHHPEKRNEKNSDPGRNGIMNQQWA